jgi:hypothetical protein
MGFRLTWKGDDILAKVRGAEPKAIEGVTGAAAAGVRSDHPGWHRRTGSGERSIVAEPVQIRGTSIVGAIGFEIRPVLFQDRGFRSHPGDRALERAADREFRKLVDRLRAAMNN